MNHVLLVIAMSLGVTGVSIAQTGATAFFLAQQPGAAPDPYVGNEMCARCHSSYEESLAGSPHENFDAISDHGCQTCHGPGRAHVQNPRDPDLRPRIDRIDVTTLRQQCLECHEDNGHDLEHFQAGQACSTCHAVHEFDDGVTGASGDARCVSCHEGGSSPSMATHADAPAAAPTHFSSRGTPHSAEPCSSCHTLGSLTDQTWEARSGTERCLGCHAQSHPRFFASSHARAGLSCKSCHAVHAEEPFDALAPSPTLGKATQTCIECHAETVTEFSFNERHRLEEGIMECTSCHNPHEPTQRVRLGGFQTQQCTQCHIDKIGPFVFEHGTSFVEGCTSCHSPHGSPNRHMLEFQSVADQCYSCHVVAPGFHGRFTSQTLCTNCHAKIHGSNLHPAFLK